MVNPGRVTGGESIKSTMPGHTDWDQGLQRFQPEGFNPYVCFWSMVQLLPCPHSFHSTGEDGLRQQAKQLMALAHCKQPLRFRERKYLTLRHIKRKEKNQQQAIPSSIWAFCPSQGTSLDFCWLAVSPSALPILSLVQTSCHRFLLGGQLEVEAFGIYYTCWVGLVMGYFYYTPPSARQRIATCPTCPGIKDYSSSMQKPPCNSQPKHIHSFMLHCPSVQNPSPPASSAFPPPNTVTISFPLLLLTAYLPASFILLCPTPFRTTSRRKRRLVGFFAHNILEHLWGLPLTFRLTRFSYRALSCPGTRLCWIGDNKSCQWSCSMLSRSQ